MLQLRVDHITIYHFSPSFSGRLVISNSNSDLTNFQIAFKHENFELLGSNTKVIKTKLGWFLNLNKDGVTNFAIKCIDKNKVFHIKVELNDKEITINSTSQD